MRNLTPTIVVASPATLRVQDHGKVLRLIAAGDWIVAEAPRLDDMLHKLRLGTGGDAEIDGSGIERLDSAGAWLLLRTSRSLEANGRHVTKLTVPERYRPLVDAIGKSDEPDALVAHRARPSIEQLLARTGQATIHVLRQAYDLVGFLGRVTVETSEAVVAPRRELPFPALIHQIEETGLTAMPIVGLLAFLLGIVLAYQAATQLKKFGAQLYTIDSIGILFLREVGGLITAIIVAGRSGSAFTAQIGTMRVNEETDAMQTIGLNLAEILVVPRVLGLMIALPLLTFFADVVGIIGGMVMTYFNLGITIPAFMRELESAITVRTLLVGLVKAPVFAFVIALVGCFEGMRVERNAASVGKLTTRSVVESIFLIIALDAGFSILFSVMGV
ncbi:MAG: MlaE family lipid ABC transporter permease subunit [Rhizomicrobium sp.]|jgi:phospholipid/cholesterol/gamma-HCH transport system permease protein